MVFNGIGELASVMKKVPDAFGRQRTCHAFSY